MTEEKAPQDDEKGRDKPVPRPAENTTSVDEDDLPPPMNAPARGPMDQSLPDVATGSTPLTRRDD